jgi:glycosyltransferase involved in cell wall biosynthesis
MLTCAQLKPRLTRAPDNPVVLEARVVCGTGGGPDKTILNSPRFLWSAGYTTLCAYMHPPGDAGFDELRRKADTCKAPILSVPDRGPWDWRVVSQFLKICRRERVTIWHGHDYKSNALGLVIRRFWPMRLVTTVHGWVKQTHRTPLYYKIDELCLPRYEAVLCVSEDLHTHCLEHGVLADRCRLIENAIDTEDFTRRKDVGTAKRLLGIPSDRLIVGAVGRLSAEKGFDLLIRAAHALRQQGINLELLIAGSGDAERQLRALIEGLGMVGHVQLLGHVPDPRSLFEAFDIFVLSSHREGLPNSVLEAMALEVPVVATRVNGVASVIRDGHNGVLIGPNSIEELVQGIRGLLDDSASRRRLAKAARRTVVEQFSFAKRMEKIRNIYDSLLGRN